jgi:hypothetical protein
MAQNDDDQMLRRAAKRRILHTNAPSTPRNPNIVNRVTAKKKSKGPLDPTASYTTAKQSYDRSRKAGSYAPGLGRK